MPRLLVVATIVLSGLVGYAVGERHGFIRGMRHLETEVARVLTLEVEAASCVRTGDHERALQLLDLDIDGSVLGLSAARTNLGFLLGGTGGVQPPEALGLATLYRRVAPPAGHDAAAVTSALNGVPAPSSVPPALRALTNQVKE